LNRRCAFGITDGVNGHAQVTASGRPLISKSKFIAGSQCHRWLWVAYNDKGRIPEADPTTQAIFDQGHEVGALAKSLYPDGIEVSAGASDFGQVIQKSMEAAKDRKPLFEAGFLYNGGFARVDILNPVGRDGWDIVEVKSSTEIKDVSLLDVAFQAFVYTGAGLRIRRCWLMTVNSEYVRSGPVDANGFFTLTDVSKDVSGLAQDIRPQLEDMFAVIQQKEPGTKIGPHCSDPYPCPLQEQCWAFLPEDNVFDLYYGGKKCWRLFNDGVIRLRDVPDHERLTDFWQDDVE
jgi:hypothetical protein